MGAILVLTAVVASSQVFGHRGGLDKDGCHKGKGEYHCHRTTEPKVAHKPVKSFRKAKRILAELYADHRQTFYCDCGFDADKRVDYEGCAYTPKRANVRASRVEWEHIVPAEAFGRSFVEWREGHPECERKGRAFKGRRCARATSPLFRQMEADLHNLVPAIGELNGLRSNYRMAAIPGEERNFGSCDVEIEDRSIEPPDEVKGDVARIYFYMDQAYPKRGIVSRSMRRLLESWARMDPVDAWECERARRLASVSVPNPVLEVACQESGFGGDR